MVGVSAPGKIIFMGDMTVGYDNYGISTAIDLRSSVNVELSSKGIIHSRKFNKEWSYSEKELEGLKSKYDKIIEKKEYNKIENHEVCDPMKYLLANIFSEIGYHDLKISTESHNIKGIGMGASIASAVTQGIYHLKDSSISKEKNIDMSIKHDFIAHCGVPSGLDSNSVTLGGFVFFRKGERGRRIYVNNRFPMLLIDTKVHKPSSYTHLRLFNFVKKFPAESKVLFDKINDLAIKAVPLLEKGDNKQLGNLMNLNQEYLRKLTLSANFIDDLIRDIKERFDIYGAKLTGAGCGGSIIVLARDYTEIISYLNNKDVDTYLINAGEEGVRVE